MFQLQAASTALSLYVGRHLRPEEDGGSRVAERGQAHHAASVLAASILSCAVRDGDGVEQDMDGDEPHFRPPRSLESAFRRPPAMSKSAQRDRTSQFLMMREMSHQAGAHSRRRSSDNLGSASESLSWQLHAIRQGVGDGPASASESLEGPAPAELHAIWEQTALLHTSLASQLMQHNGLRQFCVEFKDRSSPIEFRAMLPQLEADIDQQLMALRCLVSRLSMLDVAAGSSSQFVRDNALKNTMRIYEEMRAAFVEQRLDLQEIAVASPLTAVVSPSLSRRLTAMNSPDCSSKTGSSPPSSSTIPGRSPHPPLSLSKRMSYLMESPTLSSPSLPSGVATWGSPLGEGLAEHTDEEDSDGEELKEDSGAFRSVFSSARVAPSHPFRSAAGPPPEEGADGESHVPFGSVLSLKIEEVIKPFGPVLSPRVTRQSDP